jgi:hypothetical protein
MMPTMDGKTWKQKVSVSGVEDHIAMGFGGCVHLFDTAQFQVIGG